MRAYEIYEASEPKITPLEFCQSVLAQQYGFEEHTPGKMFVKYISKDYYITAQCAFSLMTLCLFNRNTMKIDDKFSIDGGNRGGEFIGRSEKHKVLNKITDWTRQFSSASPQL